MVTHLQNCPICHSNELAVLFKHKFKAPKDNIAGHLSDYNYVSLWILFKEIFKNQYSEFNFWMTLCQNCDLLFTNPRFTEKEIEIKYNTLSELNINEKEVLGDKLNKNYYRIIDLYRFFITYNLAPDNSEKKILDYGGASGYMLLPYYKTHKSYVLDYMKWDLPKGINYLGKNLDDLDENEKFDIILLLHTLEHVRKPKKLLEDISAHLTNNGIIIIQVPLGCFLDWLNLKEPLTHINFFSEKSLYNCVKSAGLNVSYLKTKMQKFPSWVELEIQLIATKTKNLVLKPLKSIHSSEQKITRRYLYYFKYLSAILKDPKFIVLYLKKYLKSDSRFIFFSPPTNS